MTRVTLCSGKRTYHFDTQWGSFISYNCTQSDEHKKILQGSSPFGMGQSFRRREDMAGSHDATLRGKEFLSHNTGVSSATGGDHSLDTIFPLIPYLIYHQDDERRHSDDTTSLLTTNQAMLVVRKKRQYLNGDTFAKASWQTNIDISSGCNIYRKRSSSDSV